jgi:hypothetical protein
MSFAVIALETARRMLAPPLASVIPSASPPCSLRPGTMTRRKRGTGKWP